MTAATRWARRGTFDTATTAAADERQRRERMGLWRLIATSPHDCFGKEIQNEPGLREAAQY